MPAAGRPRRAARRRERRALRRLADDPLRAQDPHRDRRAPGHARLPSLRNRRKGVNDMTTKTDTTQVYEVTIAASPEEVWDALTKPEQTRQYFYGSEYETTWEPGSPYLGRTQ